MVGSFMYQVPHDRETIGTSSPQHQNSHHAHRTHRHHTVNTSLPQKKNTGRQTCFGPFAFWAPVFTVVGIFLENLVPRNRSVEMGGPK